MKVKVSRELGAPPLMASEYFGFVAAVAGRRAAVCSIVAPLWLVHYMRNRHVVFG